jgi:hypothetical protein
MSAPDANRSRFQGQGCTHGIAGESNGGRAACSRGGPPQILYRPEYAIACLIGGDEGCAPREEHFSISPARARIDARRRVLYIAQLRAR